jgi:hypothetical protein
MTVTQAHHARIMIECGCTIEDVCVSLGMTLNEAIHAAAPALKANPVERDRVQRVVRSIRLPHSRIAA